MAVEWYVLTLGFVGGFYMAWNIGANDVANSMASAVGAKAITLRQAIFIAGILNIVGAAFIGSHVTDTIRNDIISPEILNNMDYAMTGALAALLSAAMWVSFATWRSLPVSTTHSVVGAMIGFGIIAGGFSMVNWIKLGAIVMSWVISPVFSLIISYVMFKAIVRLILIRSQSYNAALRLSPFFIGIAVFIVIMSFVFKTPLGSSLNLTTPVAGAISLLFALLAGFGGKRLLARALGSRADRDAESIFRRIQIGTSCYVALAQGANDVANAIGPLAVIYFLVKTGEVGPKVPVPFFLLLFGGIGIALGVAMGGRRVIQTVGERITALTNTRGFSVDFAAATTVLLASKMGLPVSTTHAAVGGVLGVGLAGGIEAVNFAIVFRIMLYWVLTVPVSALTCMVVFKILQVII
jgi:inorganic phosphate transporter, PiT family